MKFRMNLLRDLNGLQDVFSTRINRRTISVPSEQKHKRYAFRFFSWQFAGQQLPVLISSCEVANRFHFCDRAGIPQNSPRAGDSKSHPFSEL
jgi:hypothetical protein